MPLLSASGAQIDFIDAQPWVCVTQSLSPTRRCRQQMSIPPLPYPSQAPQSKALPDPILPRSDDVLEQWLGVPSSALGAVFQAGPPSPTGAQRALPPAW